MKLALILSAIVCSTISQITLASATVASTHDEQECTSEMVSESVEQLENPSLETFQRLTHCKPEVTPYLVDSLTHEDKYIRANSATAVGMLCLDSQAAISTLSELLNDEYWIVRSSAILSLSQIGAASSQHLIKYTEHENWKVRNNVATILGQLEDDSTEVVSALVTLLQDDNPTVRYNSVLALKKLRVNAGIVPFMFNILAKEDPNAYIRFIASSTLEEIRGPNQSTNNTESFQIPPCGSYVNRFNRQEELIVDELINTLNEPINTLDEPNSSYHIERDFRRYGIPARLRRYRIQIDTTEELSSFGPIAEKSVPELIELVQAVPVECVFFESSFSSLPFRSFCPDWVEPEQRYSPHLNIFDVGAYAILALESIASEDAIHFLITNKNTTDAIRSMILPSGGSALSGAAYRYRERSSKPVICRYEWVQRLLIWRCR